MRLSAILLCVALLPAAVQAYESGSPESAGISRYTFAWPLGEGMLKPRGATTRGAPVMLDTAPARSMEAPARARA